MIDKKSDGPFGGKKPSAIIDLKATVVDTSPGPSVETRAAFANNSAKPAADAKPAASAASVPPAKSPDATAKSPPPSPEPKAATTTATGPSKSRGGFATHLLSGVAGGILALLGATQLAPHLGLDSAGGDAARRITDLEQKLARTTAVDPQTVTATQSRLVKLEEMAQAIASNQAKVATDMKVVEDKIGKAVPGIPSDAAERLVKLEEQLSQITAAAGDPRSGRLPQIAQLTGKLGELETQLTTRTAQVKSELLQQMDQRFTRGTETIETVRSTLSQRAQSIEQQLKSVLDNTASLRTDMDTVKLDLDKRFAAAAKPADVQSAVASVATKVTSLEQTMQGVAKSEAERNQTAGNILLSLELANLKRALDRGGVYASELAAVKSLAGGKLDLGVLEASQNVGVPSLATLGQELAGIAHNMLDAESEPANASVTDRLLSGVKSIVRVRKVDFAPGDTSTEALIARMEKSLKEGRLAEVVEVSTKLDPKVAAPAAKWLDRIKSRAAIDATLAALDASLKTSLAGGAAPKKGAN